MDQRYLIIKVQQKDNHFYLRYEKHFRVLESQKIIKDLSFYYLQLLSVSMQGKKFINQPNEYCQGQDIKPQLIPTLMSNLSLQEKKQRLERTQQSDVCNHRPRGKKNFKTLQTQKKSKIIQKNCSSNNGNILKRSYKRRKQPFMKQNYKKQVLQLNNKNKELQQQVQRLRDKMECCLQCRYYAYKKQNDPKANNNVNIDTYRPNYQEEMKKVSGSLNQSKGSMGSLQFQNVDFQAPLMYAKQIDDKAWVYIGTLMIVMGSKCLQVDGTINVFRILKQSVDSLRRDVEKSLPNISLDFYLTQQQMKQCNIMEDIGFDPFTQKIGGDTGLALQGVKIQSVQQFQLLYDNKLTYNIKYEALLGAMQYLRQNSWLTF